MLFLAIATGLLVLGLLLHPRWVAWRRLRLQREPFAASWRGILKRRVPYVATMPANLQLQLKKHIQVFLAEKPFIGCAGLVVTEEMRVTIAAQACLLILNRPTDYYPRLRQVLVYPSAFRVNRDVGHDDGLVHHQRDVLEGESWDHGQVILSWDDTLAGAKGLDDGMNVVIHEFAHQLDAETGEATGMPPLPNRARRERWAQVMGHEFKALQKADHHDEPTLLDPYGATNPIEFFAVATETFFECPADLQHEHPALYRELSEFYRLDPMTW